MVADNIAGVNNSDWDILAAGLVVDGRVTILNFTTMANIGLNKDVDEVADDLFISGTSHDDEAPRLQRLRVAK